MAKPHRQTEDRRLRRKTAAFRLKHDVGKALRWSAPETREGDAAALRARLLADLFPRTSGGAASRDVLEIFFEWKKEEGPMFGAGDADLMALARAMERVVAGRDELLSHTRPPAGASAPPSSPSKKFTSSSLSSSPSFASLLALDDACLEASRLCTAFYRRVAVEDGPEIVRPPGSSGIHRRCGGGA